MDKQACSVDANPLMTAIFAARAGFASHVSAEDAMARVVRRALRRCRARANSDQRLQYLLRKRNIRILEYETYPDLDGSVEPLGSNFAAGFRVRLKKSSSPERARFSLAHEICHTFFYELLPEVKFQPHPTNVAEERLCDVGASELLMPATSVQRLAKDLPVSVSTLTDLASTYQVSIAAMFLRLRSLGLWRCELAEWRVMSNGGMSLQQVYGGKSLPWQWDDIAVRTDIERATGSCFGETFISYFDERGAQFCRPVRYETLRLGDRIFALWGRNVQPPKRSLPLFEIARGAGAAVRRRRHRASA